MFIKSTNSIKYLGIYVDSHMKWDIHIVFVEKETEKNTFLVEPNLLYDILGRSVLKTYTL